MSSVMFPKVSTDLENCSYIRVFQLECNCYYIEEVDFYSLTVKRVEYSNGVYDKEIFSKYSGYHYVGEKLTSKDIPLIKNPMSTVEMLNKQSQGIDVDSNSELLSEIFDDVSVTTNSGGLNSVNTSTADSTSGSFNENDIYVSQLTGRIDTLEKAFKKLLKTTENIYHQVEKLEKDNSDLTALVSQVLNHEVPQEMAKNVLEEMFKESL